jgi:hypothetical protein
MQTTVAIRPLANIKAVAVAGLLAAGFVAGWGVARYAPDLQSDALSPAGAPAIVVLRQGLSPDERDGLRPRVPAVQQGMSPDERDGLGAPVHPKAQGLSPDERDEQRR